MDANTLKALRRMTVANGCTPAEAEVAARKIAEWEAKQRQVLPRRRIHHEPQAVSARSGWIKPPRWNFADSPPRRRLED
jgi:hypothetical protein